jgi:hypothetical protein
MKTAMGLNAKITAGRTHRAKWRALFEALGVERIESQEAAEIALLGDGGALGVFFVADDAALPEALAASAPWLEIRVADPAAGGRALDALGTPRVEYHDQAHAYFRAPGGVVFRLAPIR